MVDKYLMSDSKKPLVGRLVGSEASGYGTDVASAVNVPAVNYGSAGPPVSAATTGAENTVTAVNYGGSDIVYGPTDNEAPSPLVAGPVGVDDTIPVGLTSKAYNDLDVDFLPSPDRASELYGIKKPENPEFYPVYFDKLPDNIKVSILNEDDYGEFSLLPESYEPDLEKPMWR